MFDFKQGIDRRGWQSEKWDCCKAVFGSDDVLPMWVADMDFAAPQVVLDALKKRVEHGAFGYTTATDTDTSAVHEWWLRRHGYALKEDWLLHQPSVVSSLRIAVRAFTQPGDGIIIQPPVYGPFYGVVRSADREVIENPWINAQTEWQIDWDQLEQCMKQAKLMLLCSPHNPIGRVWTRGELTHLVQLARQYGVYIVSDEIHADFTYPDHRHTPLLAIEGADEIGMMAISASKAFNLAALNHSWAAIPSKSHREAFAKVRAQMGLGECSVMGLLATTTAYLHGNAWLDALRQQIIRNTNYTVETIRERIPQVRVIPPQATYLLWLDMRALGESDEALFERVVRKGKLGMNSGTDFGISGSGFMRLNVACGEDTLAEGLRRLQRCMQD